jgi:hypothetical protein
MKFPRKLSPEKDDFQLTLKVFKFLISSSCAGSSGSTSSLPQNFREFKDEHELRNKINEKARRKFLL